MQLTAPHLVPTVACGESIGYAKSGHEDGYRVVLGVISVPVGAEN